MEVIEFLFLVFLTPLCYMVTALFLIYLPLSRQRDLDIPTYGSDTDALTTYLWPAGEAVIFHSSHVIRGYKI